MVYDQKWKWKSLSQLFASNIQLCVTHGLYSPWNSPGEILEWVAFPFSRGSSQPRDQTQVSCIAGDSLSTEPQGKPKNTGVGSQFFLQQIFPT